MHVNMENCTTQKPPDLNKLVRRTSQWPKSSLNCQKVSGLSNHAESGLGRRHTESGFPGGQLGIHDSYCGWTTFCTNLKPRETIVCWHLKSNRIIPGFLGCEMECASIHDSYDHFWAWRTRMRHATGAICEDLRAESGQITTVHGRNPFAPPS